MKIEELEEALRKLSPEDYYKYLLENADELSQHDHTCALRLNPPGRECDCSQGEDCCEICGSTDYRDCEVEHPNI